MQTGAACVEKPDEGDTEISLGYALAKHNHTGTESVIRSEADGGLGLGVVQRQTDTVTE